MERASLRMVNHRRAAHDVGTTGDAVSSEVAAPADTEKAAPSEPARRTARSARKALPSRRAAQHAELDAPDLYINEELARLSFNRRVLAQAEDPSTPLLERLRFLTICSSNLDEFFEIRVAGLQQKVAFGLDKRGPDGLATEAVLERIAAESHRLVAEQYRVLNEVLLPALEKEGIRLLRRSGWDTRHAAWVRAYFRRNVLPILTPVGLDPAHPFPRVLNKGLNFIVSVEGADAFGRHSGIAVVQVPRSLPRLMRFPRKASSGPHDLVMLSSIIRAHVGEIFPGMQVEGCSEFRVTRNSDLWVDEEEVDDLLAAVKGELSNRRFGTAVRLEVGSDCSEAMAQFLLSEAQLHDRDLYRADGPVNLHRLNAIHEMVSRTDLKYPPATPSVPKRLQLGDLFDAIRRSDVLLHHPYESFSPVVDLVRQAARDPNVLAVKQTLYRTGDESPVVDALLEAARAGKEVTALVELRARFDEAANIDLATRLQEAGASVAYGIVGYKCHAKALLVIRREGRRLRRYVHLGTGNYHSKTARAYTDFSFFTCDEDLGEDVQRLFQHLTGLGRPAPMRKLVASPFDLQKRLLQLIEDEEEEARAGRPARIFARMNSLSEPSVIRALYKASQAGVKIDLLVRGICCLRPGVPGVSETIRVRSVVGRFLEHGRVFHFHAGGAGKTWLASADWMPRNLFRRVETCFPLEDPKIEARALDEGLTRYFADNVQSWSLQSDGTWRRRAPGKKSPRCAQKELLAEFAAPARAARRREAGRF